MEQKTCINCGKAFEAGRDWARYCGKKCSAAWWAMERKKALAAWKKEKKAGAK